MNIYNLPINKIPGHVQEIIMAIQEIAAPDTYDFLLIGATARDLIMDGKYDIKPSRGTLDVDFAIYVPHWEGFSLIMKKLVNSGRFTGTSIQHRLCYMETTDVDILPFGAIQNTEGEYTWPPDFMDGMNVAGFIEVNNHGILIESKPDNLRFRVAPIHGICIMKLFAWKDRKYKTNKDAKDLWFILANYLELKMNIMYDQYEDLAIAEDFDIIISAARMLGRDMKEILIENPLVHAKICEIINQELLDEDNSLLVRTMAAGEICGYNRAYKALQSMLAGINDIEGRHT